MWWFFLPCTLYCNWVYFNPKAFPPLNLTKQFFLIVYSAGKFCQFIHTAAHWLSSPCLLLSLQQMVREGLNLLNLPPFPLCWLSPQYQIYTPIHNAALSQFALSASKSPAGEQSDTMPPSAILRLFGAMLSPPGSSRQAYVPLASSQAPLVLCRGAWKELALAWLWLWQLFVLYNLRLCLSLGAILQKCVCVLAWRHK